jgi:hypothetical protein
MSCTQHFLTIPWQHHTWEQRVTSFEILTRPATNMWARVVDEQYMRCDKEEVCVKCGAVRRRVSCMCDLERGQRCKVLLASQPDLRGVA